MYLKKVYQKTRFFSIKNSAIIFEPMETFDLIVIGGGAAGFFSALATAPGKKVLILEKSLKVLSKVRISGGGRCNVTHACFEPDKLVKNYPRGSRELLGPFTRFQPKDTIAWFFERGVPLKEEADGRMFPVTDSSETIIHCLVTEARNQGIVLEVGVEVTSVEKRGEGFLLQTSKGNFLTKALLLATGSGKFGFDIAASFNHTIIPPVPSLFTFNVPSSPLKELSGITLESVKVKIKGFSREETGPLLITHFGFSGPAVLRLSAFLARELNALNYQAELIVDWTNGLESLQENILKVKASTPGKLVHLEDIVPLPKNLARRLFPESIRYAEISSKAMQNLIEILTQSRYQIEGKTTNKSEFVTAGGINLSEVNFKTMESKKTKGLFFAGEILDIDGVTGGFNFQNAWTTGYIAGKNASN